MKDISKEISERINKNLDLIENNYINELREITQELILSGLATTDFFDNNVFNGGTALRLLYGLNRYSKDLDFNMIQNNENFRWEKYKNSIIEYCKKYGINIEFYNDKSEENWKVKKIEIRDESITEMLAKKRIVHKNITQKQGGHYPKTKLDMETSYFGDIKNSYYEEKNLGYPEIKTVKVFNINSLFSGKLAACLTRSERIDDTDERRLIDVGRDWFDLLWYIKNKIEPNYNLLKEKLIIHDLYKNKTIEKNTEWIKKELLERVKLLDYVKINNDLKELLKKEDKIIINQNILSDNILLMGKDGYNIKYK